MRRHSIVLLVGIICTSILTACSRPATEAESAEDALSAYDYEITFVNLTQGQPMSPPVLATHEGTGVVWKLGAAASNGVVQIAENGNNGPMLAELGKARADNTVFEFVQAGATPLAPAGSPGSTKEAAAPCAGGCPDRVTVRILAPAGDPRLSVVSMLVCTNDGFTGDNSIELPLVIGKERVVELRGYETSTERNTELLADIMPPCQGIIGVASSTKAPGTAQSNPALAEKGSIVAHRGVTGSGDLQVARHGWAEPVAKLTITRVR
jgi:hypothetical protein